MQKITVRQDGSGDFSTLSQAISALSQDASVIIDIGPGVYREKLFFETKHLRLRGAGVDRTRLVWGDGGKHLHPDGRPVHTFRSYTVFFGCGTLEVSDLTIENDAGDGRTAGQAIAAYVDCPQALFQRVRLLGRQDTLFCAPLPEKEREVNGFLGPREHAPRTPSRQVYRSCYITGDVDFIFGGADALFEDCVIHSIDTQRTGYVAAPSGHAQDIGFVFHRCRFIGEAPLGSVYLARPWRPEGRTTLLDCELGGHIAPAGFSAWNDRTDTHLAYFAESGSTGPGAAVRGEWVHRDAPADRLIAAFADL